jgi:hypothetical protein
LKELGVEAYPTLFVIDPSGKLLYRGHSVDTATAAIRAALGK